MARISNCSSERLEVVLEAQFGVRGHDRRAVIERETRFVKSIAMRVALVARWCATCWHAFAVRGAVAFRSQPRMESKTSATHAAVAPVVPLTLHTSSSSPGLV